MNLFDLFIVLAAVLAIIGGWRLGLITRTLGWVGAVLGIALSVSIVPPMVRWINPPSDSGVLLLSAGAFLLLVSVGQTVGVAIGSRLRPEPVDTVVRRIDSIGGGVLGAIGIVVLLWLFIPLLAQTEGWVSSTARGSAIARTISEHLPAPPEQIEELERNLIDGNFPELFAGLQPNPDLPDPPEGSPVSAATLDNAARSTARLQGKACGLIQSGSGFSVGDGLWVTNAHVVAGTDETTFTTPDGDRGTGTVVAFDPRVDLAVLRVDLDRPGLALDIPQQDVGGLAMGFPGGGSFEPSPFLIGETLTATGYDIYDDALVRRDLLVLAADLEPGDSGSGLIDSDGEVIGVSVAVAPDRPGVAYALRSEAVQAVLDTVADDAVDTGDCLG